MKTFSQCIFFSYLLVAFISCKKSETPEPPMVPVPFLPDTLGVGWRKAKVDSSESFTDVFFNNNNTGYIAGKNLWKSVDGGNNWTVLNANSNFANIFVTSNFKGFFVHYNNGLWQNSGGLNNFTQTIPLTSSNVNDVFFPDNNNGYFLTVNALYKTTDAGVTWNSIPYAFPGSVFSALYFINSTTGWLARGTGVYACNGSSVSPPVMLSNPLPNDKLTSIYAATATVIYAATASGVIYKSIDAGLSFNIVSNVRGNEGGFTDIHFLSSTTGYASNSTPYIYKTIDGGITWTKVVSLGSAIIIEIHFTDGTHGWACCNDGTVLIFNG